MGAQRASLSRGRWSLWLLLLGLALPSACAQAPSYREAVLHAVGQLNERSSEANLYRLLELDPPPKDVEDRSAPKPVSFRVKETVCPRTSQQPPEQCDFKENGLVKQCVGTITLDQSDDQFDLNCNELQSVRRFRRARRLSRPIIRPLPLPRPGKRPIIRPLPLPRPRPRPRPWPRPVPVLL